MTFDLQKTLSAATNGAQQDKRGEGPQMPSTTVATEPAHDAPIEAWADWVLDNTVDDDEGKCRGIRAASVLGSSGLQLMVQHIGERGES